MTGNTNNTEDQHIRDLLRWRLLEQERDDDLLTEKLTDMEAKLAFGTEALYVPSVQKEQELLKKLKQKKYSFLKWLLPVFVFGIVVSVIAIWPDSHVAPSPAKEVIGLTSPDAGLPQQRTDVVVLSDSAFTETRVAQVAEIADTVSTDTVRKAEPEHYTSGPSGIKVDYKAARHNPKFADAYENIPVLTEKEIAITKKFKERFESDVVWDLINKSKEK